MYRSTELLDIWDLTDPNCCFDQVSRIEDKYRAEDPNDPPKVVVVDSLQGIERLARKRFGDWSSEQRMDYLVGVASGLRDFAVRRDCAVWLVVKAGDASSKEARSGLAFDPLTRAIREIASAWIGLSSVERRPANDHLVITCERENGGSPKSIVVYRKGDSPLFASDVFDFGTLDDADNWF